MRCFGLFTRRQKFAVPAILVLLGSLCGVMPPRVCAQDSSTRAPRPALKRTECASTKHNHRAKEDQPAPASVSAGARKLLLRGAVIDITYVFTKYDRFRQSMEDLKRRSAEPEAQVKRERDQLRRTTQQLQGLELGSCEYNELQTEAAQLEAELKMLVQSNRRASLQQKAAVYDAAYREIVEEVARFAKEHGITIVFRLGKENESRKAEEVLRRINCPIVYQDGLDITDEILARLNRKAAQAGQ